VPIVAITAYVVFWAGYGFRYAAMVEPGVSLNLSQQVMTIFANERHRESPDGPPPTMEAYRAWSPPLGVSLALFCNDHHLLPESWLMGLLYIRSSDHWPHYFAGQVRDEGSPVYFPAVVGLKSPLSWLIGLAAAAAVLLRSKPAITPFLLAAGSAVGVYAAALFISNMNEGIRHVLPLFPFACLLMGAAAEAMWTRRPARLVIGVLSAFLVIESAIGFPNDLAYFNALGGGARGGIRWLGDSNLDWGQDLPLLADWQRQHPDEPLYFAYSGAVDPAHYGIRYINLPGGYPFGPPVQQIREPGVIAISATLLQGIYRTQEFDPAKMYARLRAQPPLDVLGGTIYLYHWNPPAPR
jgi:hypothetical protein